MDTQAPESTSSPTRVNDPYDRGPVVIVTIVVLAVLFIIMKVTGLADRVDRHYDDVALRNAATFIRPQMEGAELSQVYRVSIPQRGKYSYVLGGFRIHDDKRWAMCVHVGDEDTGIARHLVFDATSKFVFLDGNCPVKPYFPKG